MAPILSRAGNFDSLNVTAQHADEARAENAVRRPEQAYAHYLVAVDLHTGEERNRARIEVAFFGRRGEGSRCNYSVPVCHCMTRSSTRLSVRVTRIFPTSTHQSVIEVSPV
jgi:hypothetical protein